MLKKNKHTEHTIIKITTAVIGYIILISSIIVLEDKLPWLQQIFIFIGAFYFLFILKWLAGYFYNSNADQQNKHERLIRTLLAIIVGIALTALVLQLIIQLRFG